MISRTCPVCELGSGRRIEDVSSPGSGSPAAVDGETVARGERRLLAVRNTAVSATSHAVR